MAVRLPIASPQPIVCEMLTWNWAEGSRGPSRSGRCLPGSRRPHYPETSCCRSPDIAGRAGRDCVSCSEPDGTRHDSSPDGSAVSSLQLHSLPAQSDRMVRSSRPVVMPSSTACRIKSHSLVTHRAGGRFLHQQMCSRFLVFIFSSRVPASPLTLTTVALHLDDVIAVSGVGRARSKLYQCFNRSQRID